MIFLLNLNQLIAMIFSFGQSLKKLVCDDTTAFKVRAIKSSWI